MVVPAGSEPSPQSPFAFSPDGSRLVFAARRGRNPAAPAQLFLWARNSLEAQLIAGTEGARSPAWSPDGRSIAFRVGTSLRRVDVAGGAAAVVIDSTATVDGVAWSPEGAILFANSAGGISRVPATGGEPVAVTAANKSDDVHQEAPVFLPDGQHFLYMRHAINREATGVYLGSIDTPPADQPARPLLLADDGPRFVSRADGRSGHVLFQRRGTLFAQAFDIRSLQLRGEPIAVATGVAGGDVNNYMSASANGDLIAYRPRTAERGAKRTLVWVDGWLGRRVSEHSERRRECRRWVVAVDARGRAARPAARRGSRGIDGRAADGRDASRFRADDPPIHIVEWIDCLPCGDAAPPTADMGRPRRRDARRRRGW